MGPIVAAERMKKANTAQSFKMKSNKSCLIRATVSELNHSFKVYKLLQKHGCFDSATSYKNGEKTGVLQLTGASLYLLDPRAGRQSMTCKYCSAKTQQHTTREVRIIAAIGAVVVVHRRAVLRSAEPGVTPLQDLGQLI